MRIWSVDVSNNVGLADDFFRCFFISDPPLRSERANRPASPGSGLWCDWTPQPLARVSSQRTLPTPLCCHSLTHSLTHSPAHLLTGQIVEFKRPDCYDTTCFG